MKLHLYPKEARRRKSRSHAKGLNNSDSEQSPALKPHENPTTVRYQGAQLLRSASTASTHPNSNQFTLISHWHSEKQWARSRCLTLLSCSWLRRGTSEMSPCWLRHLSAELLGTRGSARHCWQWDLLPKGHLPPSWPCHSPPPASFPCKRCHPKDKSQRTNVKTKISSAQPC